MKTYDAYCAVCEANVRVSLDPTAEHPLADPDLECVDRGPSCEGMTCPLEGASARRLGELLEFLPPRARETSAPTASHADLEEAVRLGRIQAMRRGSDPAP
ncbi:MAG: hypothetical protein R3266_11050 [Gemmatimonadota bacterium]|nr:hypothetical protein [Gemmatimonadota bacterium]